ncbi:hypothetical protein PRIPAC_82075 [Pristionchus pacificus]|uniref:Uncharacterized protein n=1 Tax=Pristionchus pacificus TaxID=54126 RepID=A0A2A6CP60_PRIPA|nr:hypothetical protein PRIPAC_82075 [Pristionchus pacificus]|eukprot:PDM79888.1 hypothetical protein PRIPAC_32467 [Pristionchus pacificus]
MLLGSKNSADKLSFTPLLIMAIPVTIIYTATAFDGLLSFEQCLAVFSITYLHSLAHNIFLPLLTPAYRKKIVFLLKCVSNCTFSARVCVFFTAFFHSECLTVFSVWYFHSFVHNIFLLSLTPAYRKKIVFLVKCIGNCSYSQSARVCEKLCVPGGTLTFR